MSKDYLLIPDSHAHPDHHNKRFEWLGKLIYDTRPNVVVDIGDSADMPSLCSYDRGTKGFNDRSFLKDCASYHDAMQRLWHPYKKSKKKLPVRIKCKGNHENRIEKAMSLETTWSGLYSGADLQELDFNDEVSPYLKEINKDGVTFNHYAPTPIMSKPIGGMHSAAAIIKQKHKSYIVGHQHTRSFYEEANLIALSIGCYIDYWADYADQANNTWWRGVVRLRNVEGGVFDHEWISLDRIEKEYG